MHTLKMKAIVCTRYGSPEFLQLRELERPVPKDDEVLVKVFATTVTTADTMMRRAIPFISRFFLGFFRPNKPVTGTGFAGKIVAVGSEVKHFTVGQEVFGETGVNFGANAEYLTITETAVLALKPEAISYEEAATITDGPLTSLNFLSKLAQVSSGQRVLINGASGSLGTAAVQLAKHLGAEVTGVCSTANVDLVRSLGADYVIDYTKTDFTKTGKTYDVIFDTVGKSSFSSSKAALTANGLYLSPVLGLGLLLQMLRTGLFGAKKAIFSATGLQPHPELKQLLEKLTALLQSQQLRIVIDKRFPLEQTPKAHQYVDQGHKRGNVVIIPGSV